MRWAGIVLGVAAAALACSERRAEAPRDGGSAADVPSPADAPAADRVVPPDAPPACTGTLTGVVRFPNGIEPVPAAAVYVAFGEGPAPRSGVCGQCYQSGSLLTYTLTDARGAFRLAGIPAGAHHVVIEKGKFTRVVEVGITACDVTIPLDEDATRLPRGPSEGTIPRIAVGTGYHDAMENVLARMGLGELDGVRALQWGTEQFDVYDSGAGPGGEGLPPLAPLLRDATALAAYDVLLLDCGSAIEEASPSILTEPEVVENLRDFVLDGGRLYVTDQAYDYVEHAFPALIEWETPSGGMVDGLGELPEMEDLAEIGDMIASVDASVIDPGLRDWLAGLEVLGPGGTATIESLSVGRWAVIGRVDPARARTWLSADVSWGAIGPAPESGHRPLTVTFERGCGRVLFSSYHTARGSVDAAASELILGHLMLDLGTCIEDPVFF